MFVSEGQWCKIAFEGLKMSQCTVKGRCEAVVGETEGTYRGATNILRHPTTRGAFALISMHGRAMTPSPHFGRHDKREPRETMPVQMINKGQMQSQSSENPQKASPEATRGLGVMHYGVPRQTVASWLAGQGASDRERALLDSSPHPEHLQPHRRSGGVQSRRSSEEDKANHEDNQQCLQLAGILIKQR
jgi:hypothetical protein